jgi:glycosyltransferase involved in cell wall biosynthesis
MEIVGDGPQRKFLGRLAGPNIKFLGKVSMDVLIEKYSQCRALIFPGDEDFGIVPVEAQACGRPVIAYAAGEALETVIENITGVFFKNPTVESLVEVIKKFDKIKNGFSSETIRKNAFRFDEEIFKRKIKAFIKEKYSEFKKKQRT